MSKLEDLQPNASLRGVLPDALVTVVNVQWFGSEALELTYKDAGRQARQRAALPPRRAPDRDRREGAALELRRRWRSLPPGLRGAAHPPRPSVRPACWPSTPRSSIPLPHQITAVYEAMLPRQPLRFLLADDPGAGKTIMAGLLIKELIARGDLQRCLIVCPGSLAEQWQDELYRRFHLPFEILTNDKLEAARTGNWFLETNLVIARLDKLSRNEDVQHKLQAPDCRWDLVVCDEAHKMSATVFGGEAKYTKRYRLGQLLSTPHAALPADDRHAAQRQGSGLPALHGPARRRPLRGPLPRRRPRGRRLRPDAPDGEGEPAQVRRHAALPRAHRLHRPLQAFDRPRRTSTRRSPSTSARSSTAPRRSRTTSAPAPSASRSPSCSAASPPRPRRSTSRCAAGASGWRAGSASWKCSSVGARPRRSSPSPSRSSTPRTSRTSKRPRTTKSRPPRRRSSTRRPRPARSPSCRSKSGPCRRLEGLALAVRRSGRDTKWRELASLLGEIFTRGEHSWEGPPSQAADVPLPKPSPHQKLVIFTEHRDTLNYLQKKHHHSPRPRGSRRHHPRRHGPRGSPDGAGIVPA